MEQICISCLSQTRKLCVIKRKYWNLYRWILRNQKMNTNFMVCWECEAVLERFYLFKQRTQKNARLLQNCPNFRELKCQSRLSKITFVDGKELEAFVTMKNYDDHDIKTEYDEDSQNHYKTDDFTGDRLEDVFAKDEKLDCEEIKLENNIDCNSENDTKVCTELDGIEGNAMNKPEINQKFLSEHEHSDTWTTEIVSEKQMLEWRQQEENKARYKRLAIRCTTCLIPFNHEDQLDAHNSKHHDESLGSYICDICQSRFSIEIRLKKHRQTHFTLYKCLKCVFVSKEFNVLKKHITNDHLEANIECDDCGAFFKTLNRLSKHKHTKHKGSYQCRYCSRKFTFRTKMYKHVERDHDNLPAEQCHICQKMSRNSYTLAMHMKSHSEVKDVFYCSECDVHYKNFYSYKKHLETTKKHLKPEDIRYECEECGRRYLTLKKKQKHYDMRHLKKGRYTCDRCPKSFCSNEARRKHTAKVHDLSYVTPPRDKICDVCGKTFALKRCLVNHMRIHTGEKPHKCKLCPARFRQEGSLHGHNKIVHQKIKRKSSYVKKALRKQASAEQTENDTI